MMTRKSSLCDAFDTVCGSYDGDMDDIVTLLDSYEAARPSVWRSRWTTARCSTSSFLQTAATMPRRTLSSA